MAESQYIQWFPGHMTKTLRQMKKDIELVDAVVEIIDARIPASSRNPDLPEIVGSKPVIILLNKCDMADSAVTKQWIEYFKQKNITALEVDCKTGKGLEQFKNTVKKVLEHKLIAYKEKGMAGKALRVMVAGIPNVGKSTFINRIAGVNKANAENRPGVTRGNQWFTADKQLELLDTPGVLWPRFSNNTIGEHLAFTGAVKDSVIDIEWLAVRLIEALSVSYKDLLNARYGELDFDCEPYEILEQIAIKRGMKIRGGEADTLRASNILMEEFRNNKIGNISLERVGDFA